ncbi:hypothetical protein Hanom_Chr02g00144161 [Helianthus anomalus]
MVCEFLSSFDFAPRSADQPEELDDPNHPWIEVSFHLASQWHEMSLKELTLHCSLYKVEELDTPHLPRGHPYGPSYDSLEVLAGDQHPSLRPEVEVEGFLNHRSPVPLPSQAYCHIHCTA